MSDNASDKRLKLKRNLKQTKLLKPNNNNFDDFIDKI